MPVYMSKDDLGKSAALSFRRTVNSGQLASDVQHLADDWAKPAGRSQIGREDWLRTWRNMTVLASRLFDTVDTQGRSDAESFHHLLMAVGNFKRQAGDIHPPVDFAGPVSKQRPKSLVMPGDLGRLECDEVAAWQWLKRIPGLGIPTASCLLAALWPDSHVIMDVRDRRAPIGLQVGRHSHNDQRLDAAWVPGDEWWLYDWFRHTVRLTARDANCEPVLVERALYVLGVRTAKELSKKWERNGTWSEYYRAAIGQVDGLLKPPDASDRLAQSAVSESVYRLRCSAARTASTHARTGSAHTRTAIPTAMRCLAPLRGRVRVSRWLCGRGRGRRRWCRRTSGGWCGRWRARPCSSRRWGRASR